MPGPGLVAPRAPTLPNIAQSTRQARRAPTSWASDVARHPVPRELAAQGEGHAHHGVEMGPRDGPDGEDHGHDHERRRDDGLGPADRPLAHGVDHAAATAHHHEEERPQHLAGEPAPPLRRVGELADPTRLDQVDRLALLGSGDGRRGLLDHPATMPDAGRRAPGRVTPTAGRVRVTSGRSEPVGYHAGTSRGRGLGARPGEGGRMNCSRCGQPLVEGAAVVRQLRRADGRRCCPRTARCRCVAGARLQVRRPAVDQHRQGHRRRRGGPVHLALLALVRGECRPGSFTADGLTAHGYLYIVLFLLLGEIGYLAARAGWDQVRAKVPVPHQPGPARRQRRQPGAGRHRLLGQGTERRRLALRRLRRAGGRHRGRRPQAGRPGDEPPQGVSVA